MSITDSGYTESAAPIVESDPRQEVEDSEMILGHLKQKYEKQKEELEELKEDDKRDQAAQVFTKRRYRQVMATLKKGGTMISDAAQATQKESVKLLDQVSARARIHNINTKIDELMTRLGREAYDLVVMDIKNVFDNANVKKILARLTEYHGEIESIEQKLKEAENAKS